MSAASALARGRAAAEALMLDACVIRRTTGTVTDQDTGTTTPTYSTLYTGPCKLQRQVGASGPRLVEDVGEAARVLVDVELHLPIAASGGLADGDEATMTAAAYDADLVGTVFRIAGPARGSMKTARRLAVTEVAS